MSLELGDKTIEKPTLFSGNGSVTPKPYIQASCCPSIEYKDIFKHKIIYMPINFATPYAIHKGIKLKKYAKRRCGKMTEIENKTHLHKETQLYI